MLGQERAGQQLSSGPAAGTGGEEASSVSDWEVAAGRTSGGWQVEVEGRGRRQAPDRQRSGEPCQASQRGSTAC